MIDASWGRISVSVSFMLLPVSISLAYYDKRIPLSPSLTSPLRPLFPKQTRHGNISGKI